MINIHYALTFFNRKLPVNQTRPDASLINPKVRQKMIIGFSEGSHGLRRKYCKKAFLGHFVTEGAEKSHIFVKYKSHVFF